MKNNSDIGIYGLGSMGKNIALNFIGKGFVVSVCNRSDMEESELVSNFIAETNKIVNGFYDIENFILSLKKPRKILIMITSGDAVDAVVSKIVKFTDSEDIIIDAGNSSYLDTEKRINRYDVRYLGCGVSGGWYGARYGPSMMFGGSKSAWLEVQELFNEVASSRKNGTACCDWFGSGGAGHFIKMVHNGIEYAMMQSIAEAYDILRKTTTLSNDDVSLIFKEMNNGDLHSYLMDISSKLLLIKDGSDLLIDNVVDRSDQKGTGINFAICSLMYGVSTSIITEAINARFISCSEYRRGCNFQYDNVSLYSDNSELYTILLDSIYCSYVASIFQGLSLINKVSENKSWNIDLRKVIAVWEDGCIIRSSVLNKIYGYLDQMPLEDVLFKELTTHKIKSLSKTVCFGAMGTIPLPVFTSTLNYYSSLSSNNLPANLIQLQREYFGSHGLERKNNPRVSFHISEIFSNS